MGPAAEGPRGRVTGDELKEATRQAVQDVEARGFSLCSMAQAAATAEAERPVRRFCRVQPGGDPGGGRGHGVEESHPGTGKEGPQGLLPPQRGVPEDGVWPE